MDTDSGVSISAAVYSDVGNLRKHNEDSFCISEDKNLVIVCDGMGGKVAGGLASQMAVDTIKDFFLHVEQEQLDQLIADLDKGLSLSTRRLITAVRLANRRIYDMAVRIPKLRGMGTTIVALIVDQSIATMVHVGDSRIYRVSDGKIWQLTEDHSWVNQLVENQEISKEDIRTFNKKSLITRALGIRPRVQIDIHCEKYKKDDVYILCTDGLHNSIGEKEIKRLHDRNKKSIERLTKKLISRAKDVDGSDNITAAVARIDQNSDDTPVIGISTTVAIEEDQVLIAEDRFIQERFGEQYVKLYHYPEEKDTSANAVPVQKPKDDQNLKSVDDSNGFSRNPLRLVAASLAIAMAIVGFLVGRFFVPVDSASERAWHAQNGEEIKSLPLPVNGFEKKGKALAKFPSFLPIRPGQVRRDAVLALVFFNSLEEFERSELDKRSLVLDSFYPYFNNPAFEVMEGRLSLFLIDDANNVLHQKTDVKLPSLPE